MQRITNSARFILLTANIIILLCVTFIWVRSYRKYDALLARTIAENGDPVEMHAFELSCARGSIFVHKYRAFITPTEAVILRQVPRFEHAYNISSSTFIDKLPMSRRTIWNKLGFATAFISGPAMVVPCWFVTLFLAVWPARVLPARFVNYFRKQQWRLRRGPSGFEVIDHTIQKEGSN